MKDEMITKKKMGKEKKKRLKEEGKKEEQDHVSRYICVITSPVLVQQVHFLLPSVNQTGPYSVDALK